MKKIFLILSLFAGLLTTKVVAFCCGSKAVKTIEPQRLERTFAMTHYPLIEEWTEVMPKSLAVFGEPAANLLLHQLLDQQEYDALLQIIPENSHNNNFIHPETGRSLRYRLEDPRESHTHPQANVVLQKLIDCRTTSIIIAPVELVKALNSGMMDELHTMLNITPQLAESIHPVRKLTMLECAQRRYDVAALRADKPAINQATAVIQLLLGRQRSAFEMDQFEINKRFARGDYEGVLQKLQQTQRTHIFDGKESLLARTKRTLKTINPATVEAVVILKKIEAHLTDSIGELPNQKLVFRLFEAIEAANGVEVTAMLSKHPKILQSYDPAVFCNALDKIGLLIMSHANQDDLISRWIEIAQKIKEIATQHNIELAIKDLSLRQRLEQLAMPQHSLSAPSSQEQLRSETPQPESHSARTMA